jgi:hypothetical protein
MDVAIGLFACVPPTQLAGEQSSKKRLVAVIVKAEN